MSAIRRSAGKLAMTIEQRIHELWDDLTHFSAAQADDALQYLLLALCNLTQAQRAYWIGIVQMESGTSGDPPRGWRLRAIHRTWCTPMHDRLYSEHWRRIETGELDPLVAMTLAGVGSHRINTLREHVPHDWEGSEFYAQLYAPMALRDVMHVGIPVGDGVETWIGLERIGSEAPFFSTADRDRVAHILRPLKWFHQRMVLHRGVLLNEEALTASENRVLNALLTNKTEQEIATVLKLSPTTVHTYCTRICRKFGVRGRTGLTALWLGQATAMLP